MASFLVAVQGCGTCSSEARDATVGEDVPTETANARDSGGGILLAPSCGSAISNQAIARVTAAVGCFSGRVVNVGCGGTSTVCARFDFGFDSTFGYAFRACDSASQGHIANLEATATSAVQGIETLGCSLSASVSNSDFESLKETIISCAGPVYSIVFDSNGAVADVQSNPPVDGESRVLDCILAAKGGVSFPCLSNVQLCFTANSSN